MARAASPVPPIVFRRSITLASRSPIQLDRGPDDVSQPKTLNELLARVTASVYPYVARGTTT